MNERLLADRTAVVTGAASGIGRAVAGRFAAEGATVYVADVDAEDGRETVADVADADTPGDARFVAADVTHTDEVRALFETVVDERGGVDVLVNNAGGGYGDDRLHRLSDDAWERTLALNLTGVFRCAREALRAMLAGGGGVMVHVSSVNGLHGIGQTAYSAAKSGVLGLSRLVAVQYGGHGVRSNVVAPGTVATEGRVEYMERHEGAAATDQWYDQYPGRRFATPEEVADAVLFLASGMSSFVNGTELVVDGGLTAGLDDTFHRTVHDVDDLSDP